MLVIGPYRLGFALVPKGDRSELRVSIDYDLPHRGAGRWLGRIFGRRTERMIRDAAARFNSPPA